jgi:hypothetical protein
MSFTHSHTHTKLQTEYSINIFQLNSHTKKANLPFFISLLYIFLYLVPDMSNQTNFMQILKRCITNSRLALDVVKEFDHQTHQVTHKHPIFWDAYHAIKFDDFTTKYDQIIRAENIHAKFRDLVCLVCYFMIQTAANALVSCSGYGSFELMIILDQLIANQCRTGLNDTLQIWTYSLELYAKIRNNVCPSITLWRAANYHIKHGIPFINFDGELVTDIIFDTDYYMENRTLLDI